MKRLFLILLITLLFFNCIRAPVNNETNETNVTNDNEISWEGEFSNIDISDLFKNTEDQENTE